MGEYLRNCNYHNIKMTKDYIFAEGDIPIALVAHLDTVFEKPVRTLYYDERKNVMWSPDGLGADDRAGVFAIVKILMKGYRPHIIFTTDEEKGCLGAEALVKDFLISPFKMRYIIQLDRRGTNDCVFYDCANEKFTNYVSSFGFVENFGSFSDISVICPAWKIAGVNLSVGYEDEHTYIETLHITPFLATIDKVCKMLEDVNDEFFVYVSNPYSYKWNYSQKWFSDIEEIQCCKCHEKFFDYELFPVKCKDRKTRLYCPDCIVSNEIKWCIECGEAFESDVENINVCEDCRKKEENKNAGD
jgi:hypothetical protein